MFAPAPYFGVRRFRLPFGLFVKTETRPGGYRKIALCKRGYGFTGSDRVLASIAL